MMVTVDCCAGALVGAQHVAGGARARVRAGQVAATLRARPLPLALVAVCATTQ